MGYTCATCRGQLGENRRGTSFWGHFSWQPFHISPGIGSQQETTEDIVPSGEVLQSDGKRPLMACSAGLDQWSPFSRQTLEGARGYESVISSGILFCFLFASCLVPAWFCNFCPASCLLFDSSAFTGPCSPSLTHSPSCWMLGRTPAVL